MFRLLLALVVGLATLPIGPVSAQSSSLSEISEGQALFIAGRSAFNEGRYEAAYDYFRQSLELSGRKVLRFNIAQCLDRLRRDKEALAEFELYLREVPDAANRAEVESRIKILRAAESRSMAPILPSPVATTEPVAGTEGPAPAVPDANTEPVAAQVTAQAFEPADGTASGEAPSSAGSPFPLGPVLTMGGGGVVAVVGGLLMVSGLATKADVTSASRGEQSASTLLGDSQSAQDTFLAGQVLLYGGLAVAAGGLVWLLLGNAVDEQPDIALLPGPTGLAVAGRF